MKNIKCLLIDDESPAVELLEKYASMIEQLEVVGTSHSAIKAFDMLKDTPVDLMFLDIQMPVLNGIDFIKSLKNPPAIILTTAYREYALDGYELDIIDYLLKPIAFDRFLKAVDKFRERKNVIATELNPSATITKEAEHIFFNVNRTHYKLFLRDILHLESLKDYVRIHTTKDSLVVKGNLGTVLSQLPSNQFVRTHRSFAVSLKHISSYSQSEVEINGIKIPIGSSYREVFLKNMVT